MTEGKAYAVAILFKNGEDRIFYPDSEDDVIPLSELLPFVEALFEKDTTYVRLWGSLISPQEVVFAEVLEEGDEWSFPSQ